MKRNLSRVLVLLFPIAVAAASAQSTPDYDALLQQGKIQLQSGSNDAALASANAAIKLDANRWEAYALLAGANVNLGDCDAAKQAISEGIQKTPEEKRSALQALAGNCIPRTEASSDASSASLDETSDWLASALRGYGGREDYNDMAKHWRFSRISNVRIDSACILHYSQHTDGSHELVSEDEDVSIPLGAVTDVQAKDTHSRYAGGRLVYLTTGQINAIQFMHRLGDALPSPSSSSVVSIGVNFEPPTAKEAGSMVQPSRDEMLPRITHAIEHAVTLCQGTYKQPTQPKQPF